MTASSLEAATPFTIGCSECAVIGPAEQAVPLRCVARRCSAKGVVANRASGAKGARSAIDCTHDTTRCWRDVLRDISRRFVLRTAVELLIDPSPFGRHDDGDGARLVRSSRPRLRGGSIHRLADHAPATGSRRGLRAPESNGGAPRARGLAPRSAREERALERRERRNMPGRWFRQRPAPRRLLHRRRRRKGDDGHGVLGGPRDRPLADGSPREPLHRANAAAPLPCSQQPDVRGQRGAHRRRRFVAAALGRRRRRRNQSVDRHPRQPIHASLGCSVRSAQS